eukprot:12158274-Alexandrium_andersonii.AAC.1
MGRPPSWGTGCADKGGGGALARPGRQRSRHSVGSPPGPPAGMRRQSGTRSSLPSDKCRVRMGVLRLG